MNNIAIIGAGQLGSRHLQSLVNSKNKLNIQVVDSSIESLNIAEQRFKEVSQNFNGQISFHTSIDFLEKNIDVAIIATSSKVRRLVVEELVIKTKIKNIVLEKFLFTKIEDYNVVAEILNANNIKAWVNCPRRMMEFYQNLKEQIKGPIHFTATGNAWGLGCNGIHLLDLFAYFAQTTQVVLSNNLLDKTTLTSKRAGYIEFTGTISGYSDANSFQITSFANDSSPLQISINTPTVRYHIFEGVNAKASIVKLEENWKPSEEEFKMPFQSQLTSVFIDELIDTQNCSLTPFADSSALHLVFLNNLIEFLRKTKNDNSINECQIT